MSRRKSCAVTTKYSQELVSPGLKLSTTATWACVHCSFSRGIDGSLVLLRHLSTGNMQKLANRVITNKVSTQQRKQSEETAHKKRRNVCQPVI